MLKNQLFFKIILIFTLPALGILYFTTKLVLEKLENTKLIHQSLELVNFVNISNEFVHSLQKERGLSVIYSKNQKFYDDLKLQRKITDEKYNNFLSYENNINDFSLQKNIDLQIKNIQDKYYLLENNRTKITNLEVNPIDVLNFYTKLNDELILNLNSMNFPNQYNDFVNIINFMILKEQAGVERALTSFLLDIKEITPEINSLLIKSYTIQETNLAYFKKNSSIDTLNVYGNKIPLSLDEKINNFRKDLDTILIDDSYDLKYWWDLSTKRIESLNYVFNKMMNELKNRVVYKRNSADLDEKFSLFFLIVCFATLISLLFVLRNIIFNEQKSFQKIEKQKKVYELLNRANKHLLEKKSKEELFEEINMIISKNSNMVFSFIYDFEEKEDSKRIYAQDGEIKSLLISKLEEYKKNDNDTLISRVKKWKTNIVIENFANDNISVFSDCSEKYNIKSAGAFPIMRFNEIVAVLIIYSNQHKFFDYEIEIIFDSMIFDMNHTLERFNYERLRVAQEKKLKTSSVAFESSEPMLITDEYANIIEVNHAFCEFMKYSKEELIGNNPRIFKSPHQNKEFYTALWDRVKIKGFWNGEIYNTNGENEIVPVRLTVTAIKDEEGNIVNYLGQYIDISDLKDKEQILQYQATHDNLTALPNRLLLLDRIEHAITKVVRHKIVGGLIFIDLDNFKMINDTLGHDIGDLLLIEVSKKLKSVVREEDTVSRIGGDEFIVLIDNIGNNRKDALINIETLANKIKDTLNSIEYIDGHKNISTPSIGVTLFSDSSVSVKDIIKQADKAMYEAKKQGKNAIEFFN